MVGKGSEYFDIDIFIVFTFSGWCKLNFMVAFKEVG